MKILFITICLIFYTYNTYKYNGFVFSLNLKNQIQKNLYSNLDMNKISKVK
jgi:hypothetical protein